MTEPPCLALDVLPPLADDDISPPGPTPAAGPSLAWHPTAEPVALADRAVGDYVSLGSFASWLHQAEILDPYAIELPGATVLLGPGVALVRQMRRIVTSHYEAAGYVEVDFPLVVPPAAIEPSRAVIGLDNALLFAGNDADWSAGTRRALLSPTGESSVYSYWARRIRSRSDLPQRLFRQARYFRPAGAGRSLLRGIESADVFEFHACHADRASNQAEFTRAVEMCRQACDKLQVPAFFSVRPPWTNNGSVAEVCVGIDLPLPHGATLQIGCLYDQGDRFSGPYGVQWRAEGNRHHTHHLAGCLTRRVLLAHLFLGLDEDGELLVHPEIAPVQVGITVHSSEDRTAALASALADTLDRAGVRVASAGCADSPTPGVRQRTWRRQGVPLRIYIHPDRRSNDGVRVVVCRADTREECVLEDPSPNELVPSLLTALDQVGFGYVARSRRFVSRQLVRSDAGTVRDVIASRRVAVCHLEPTEAAVRAVAEWRRGEVIGFRRSDTTAPCVISGRPTSAIAYLSPRT